MKDITKKTLSKLFQTKMKSAEDILATMLAEEIRKEIDKEILEKLRSITSESSLDTATKPESIDEISKMLDFQFKN